LEQLIKTIILGIIQGVTEWLPISSTGHLELSNIFLGLEMPISFDGVLHIGTLIVILVFFRKEVCKILSALAHSDFKTEHGRMIPLIVVGSIPTALIGLVFGWEIESIFQTVLSIGIAFIFFGALLYSSKFGKGKSDSVSYYAAIVMGIAQGVAIIPGVSRSGATIAVALLLGIKREKAFRFSFLLSIPSILGATCYTVYAEFDKLTSSALGWPELLAGAIVAMLVGYFAIKLLWKILTKEKFHLFAFYCWLLGTALVFLTFFQPFGASG